MRVLSCCVPGCNSHLKQHQKKLTFHSFPKRGSFKVSIKNNLGEVESIDNKKIWKSNLNCMKKIVKSSKMKVCSLHFTDIDFIPHSSLHQRFLKKTAFPTMQLPSTSNDLLIYKFEDRADQIEYIQDKPNLVSAINNTCSEMNEIEDIDMVCNEVNGHNISIGENNSTSDTPLINLNQDEINLLSDTEDDIQMLSKDGEGTNVLYTSFNDNNNEDAQQITYEDEIILLSDTENEDIPIEQINNIHMSCNEVNGDNISICNNNSTSEDAQQLNLNQDESQLLNDIDNECISMKHIENIQMLSNVEATNILYTSFNVVNITSENAQQITCNEDEIVELSDSESECISNEQIEDIDMVCNEVNGDNILISDNNSLLEDTQLNLNQDEMNLLGGTENEYISIIENINMVSNEVEGTNKLYPSVSENNSKLNDLQAKSNRNEANLLGATEIDCIPIKHIEGTDILYPSVSKNNSTLNDLQVKLNRNEANLLGATEIDCIPIKHIEGTDILYPSVSKNNSTLNVLQVKSNRNEANLFGGTENDYIPIKHIEGTDILYPSVSENNSTLNNLQAKSNRNDANLFGPTENDYIPIKHIEGTDILYRSVDLFPSSKNYSTSDDAQQLKANENEINLLSAIDNELNAINQIGDIHLLCNEVPFVNNSTFKDTQMKSNKNEANILRTSETENIPIKHMVSNTVEGTNILYPSDTDNICTSEDAQPITSNRNEIIMLMDTVSECTLIKQEAIISEDAQQITSNQNEIIMLSDKASELNPIKQEDIEDIDMLYNQLTNLLNPSVSENNSTLEDARQLKANQNEINLSSTTDNEYISIKQIGDIHMLSNEVEGNNILNSFVSKNNSILNDIQVKSNQNEAILLGATKTDYIPIKQIKSTNILYPSVSAKSSRSEDAQQLKAKQNKIKLSSTTDNEYISIKQIGDIHKLSNEVEDPNILNPFVSKNNSILNDIQLKSNQNEANLLGNTKTDYIPVKQIKSTNMLYPSVSANSNRLENVQQLKANHNEINLSSTTDNGYISIKQIGDIHMLSNEVEDPNILNPFVSKNNSILNDIQLKSNQNEANLLGATKTEYIPIKQIKSTNILYPSVSANSSRLENVQQLKENLNGINMSSTTDNGYISIKQIGNIHMLCNEAPSNQNEGNILSTAETEFTLIKQETIISEDFQQITSNQNETIMLSDTVNPIKQEAIEDIDMVYNEIDGLLDTLISKNKVEDTIPQIKSEDETTLSSSPVSELDCISEKFKSPQVKFKPLVDQKILTQILDEHCYSIQFPKSKLNIHLCNHCGVTFACNEILVMHQRIWTCINCNTNLHAQCEQRKHMNMCYRCDDCRHHFVDERDYQNHTDWKGGITCSCSLINFKSECALQIHNVKMHGLRKCSNCYAVYHMKNEDDHSVCQVSCANCRKVFSSQCLLKLHHNYCIRCIGCKCIFKHISYMQKHKEAIYLRKTNHDGSALFKTLCQFYKYSKSKCVDGKCTFSKMPFKHPAQLKAHYCPYVSNRCNNCMKVFKTTSYWKKHIIEGICGKRRSYKSTRETCA